MAIDGFRLEFDDGTVFRATENVQFSHQGQSLYPIDGFSNFVAIYNNFFDVAGQDGRADSNYQAVFFGFGAGVHTIRVEFIGGWEGSTDTWWDSAAGDSAVSKLQTLNRALTTKRMDSESPGLLRVGEYEPSGKFDELPVALGEFDLSFDPEQHSSDFQGFINFRECIDLSRSNSAAARDRG